MVSGFATHGLFRKPFLDENQHISMKGQYHYFCNQQPVDIDENWYAIQSDAISVQIVSVRTVKESGSQLWVQTKSRAGKIHTVEVQWQQPLSSPHWVEARYRIHGRQLLVERNVNGVISQDTQVLPHHEVVISPLMRVYAGQTLQCIVELGGKALVLVPWIHDPADEARFLTPQISERCASVDVESLSNAGEVCYRYSGDQYDDSARFWVRDNLLSRYQWQQADQFWQVTLDIL